MITIGAHLSMAACGGRATAAGGWCAVAPGSAYRSTPVSRAAAGASLRSGTSIWVSVSPGRSELLGLYLFTSFLP